MTNKDLKLVSISGSSGVGKTTIAKMIGLVLSDKDVVHLVPILHTGLINVRNHNFPPRLTQKNPSSISFFHLTNFKIVPNSTYNRISTIVSD